MFADWDEEDLNIKIDAIMDQVIKAHRSGFKAAAGGVAGPIMSCDVPFELSSAETGRHMANTSSRVATFVGTVRFNPPWLFCWVFGKDALRITC